MTSKHLGSEGGSNIIMRSHPFPLGLLDYDCQIAFFQRGFACFISRFPSLNGVLCVPHFREIALLTFLRFRMP